MKVVSFIPQNNYLFSKEEFRRIPAKDPVRPEENFLIFLNGQLIGSISVHYDEIKDVIIMKGVDEKYVLDKVLCLMERRASEKHFIKYYIYSDTDHTTFFENLGFFKRKRFYDNDDKKYFKMFKIV